MIPAYERQSMKAAEIREKFLQYFSKQKHEVVASSPLIPEGDSTLLFTNAGMFQFKNVFLGVDKRNYSRATTSQKCVRAGGKHNDLENVGHTARHHTFFEMLGNFSFGDYFKEDAIRYAWEFLTQELQIPKDKLYVTVFTDDDEAAEIWQKQEQVPAHRIFRFGEKDNFWRMGDTGPCGPCSEIFYDHEPEKGECKSAEDFEKGQDEDRFIEIWNLVFMQFYEEPKGTLTPLPKPSVDTGAGLERIAALMQGSSVNYESDLFQDYIEKTEELTGRNYKENKEVTAAMRVLADHARCSSFLIADGVLPSNEGRGYVLRRIIRRAIRYGRNLSQDSLLHILAELVIQKMGSAYPELEQQSNLILNTLKQEEERFLKTLDQGTQILNKAINELKVLKKSRLDGELVFKLYDTYGFPSDLTRLIAKEQDLSIDEEGFQKHMAQAKEKARASWKGQTIQADQALLLKLAQTYGSTQFTGYTHLQEEGVVLAIADTTKELEASQGKAFVIVDQTCFYAEGGGQVGDVGSFEGKGVSGRIFNCTKVDATHILHLEVEQGELQKGQKIRMLVEHSSRRLTAANHSATHLLHSALRKELGDHVTQAGSYVDAERLRFDFTHSKPLSQKEIDTIEDLVHREIARATTVKSEIMPYQKAIDTGAIAMFGEKYGDEVRVIEMGDFSVELCGGTHVQNLNEIRAFKIVSETGVSAGVRRIEAITSDLAVAYFLKHTRENQETRENIGFKESWTQFMGIEQTPKENHVMEWIDQLRQKNKELQKEIQALKVNEIDYDAIVGRAKKVGELNLITADIEMEDRKLLIQVAERLRDKAEPALVVLVGQGEENHPILVSLTKTLSKQYSAGNILKEIAGKLGGKGGGRPDFAQGAIPNRNQMQQAFEIAEAMLQA